MSQKNQTDLITRLKDAEEKLCQKNDESELDKTVKSNIKNIFLLAALYGERNET